MAVRKLQGHAVSSLSPDKVKSTHPKFVDSPNAVPPKATSTLMGRQGMALDSPYKNIQVESNNVSSGYPGSVF